MFVDISHLAFKAYSSLYEEICIQKTIKKFFSHSYYNFLGLGHVGTDLSDILSRKHLSTTQEYLERTLEHNTDFILEVFIQPRVQKENLRGTAANGYLLFCEFILTHSTGKSDSRSF